MSDRMRPGSAQAKIGQPARDGLTGRAERFGHAPGRGAHPLAQLRRPLITLGIPGSAATAILIGGCLMWGLQPGPLLMEQNPEFAWGLIASMYLGNMMLVLVNIFCIPVFAALARVPFRVLGPIVIVLCTLGTYAAHSSLLEVQIVLACRVLGRPLRRGVTAVLGAIGRRRAEDRGDIEQRAR